MGVCFSSVRKIVRRIYARSAKILNRNSDYCLANVESIDFSQINSILFVAHPDDEAIFFYEYLRRVPAFVVCLTNGNIFLRRREFAKSCNILRVPFVILNFPDRAGELLVEQELLKAVDYYLGLKPWATVLAHNEFGEYGHVHHQQIHQAVKSRVNSNAFELLCPPALLDLPGYPLPEAFLKEKISHFKSCYRSQAVGILDVAGPYRTWMLYEQLSRVVPG